MTTQNLIFKTGDMFTTSLPAIAHGVNCHAAMRSGVAAIVARKFPEVEEAYNELCDNGELEPGDMFAMKSEDGKIVLNLASQNLPGADARLDWLRASYIEALQHCADYDIKGFAMPRIGAGIGGLQWEDVLAVIEEETAKAPNVTVEVWSL